MQVLARQYKYNIKKLEHWIDHDESGERLRLETVEDRDEIPTDEEEEMSAVVIPGDHDTGVAQEQKEVHVLLHIMSTTLLQLLFETSHSCP